MSSKELWITLMFHNSLCPVTDRLDLVRVEYLGTPRLLGGGSTVGLALYPHIELFSFTTANCSLATQSCKSTVDLIFRKLGNSSCRCCCRELQFAGNSHFSKDFCDLTLEFHFIGRGGWAPEVIIGGELQTITTNYWIIVSHNWVGLGGDITSHHRGRSLIN